MDRQALQERFGIIGESPEIKQVLDKILQISSTDITVLLQGETGVGKDVTARAIHETSPRKHDNLIIVNCGAIPEGIIESELFGHEKGAFTGAHEAREGYFEKANRGTIFLDEIGDTPKNVQVKLLRVLETGEYFRVGSSKLRKTDVRVIAATNKELYSLVQDDSFREDLYYRLDTVKIRIPPLRDRREDILLIFRKFVNEFAGKYDSVFQGFSDEARELLTSYRWPGNIRELRNIAEQLVVLEKSKYIDKETLQKYLKGRQHEGSTDNLPVLSTAEQQSSSSAEPSEPDRELIYRVLIELRNDMSDLKRMLGNYFSFTYSGGAQGNQLFLPPSQSSEAGGGGYQPQPSAASQFEGFEYPQEADAEESTNGGFDSFFEGDIPSIEETEQYLIEKALEHFEGNRRKASEALGISERTLYRKLDQYGLS